MRYLCENIMKCPNIRIIKLPTGQDFPYPCTGTMLAKKMRMCTGCRARIITAQRAVAKATK